MKLKTFKVVGVWGALTKEISFRDHTTFLIGINGSGKTTVLNLLDGLLKPNLKKLLFVDFKEVSLIYERFMFSIASLLFFSCSGQTCSASKVRLIADSNFA